MNKYKNAYIVMIDNTTFNHQIEFKEFNNKNSCLIFISRINYNELMNLDQLITNIKQLNAVFIPRVQDLKFAAHNYKNPQLTLNCKWIMDKKPYFNLLMENNVKYLISNVPIPEECVDIKKIKNKNNNLEWHQKYNGEFGFAISQHENPADEILYFGYSISINHKLDGVYIQNINEKNVKNPIKL